ncbi:hypothetical protein LCGC14_2059930, partial [marine sediment metagenome]
GVVALHWQALHAKKADERTTLSLLRSETMAFLVTRRSSIQVVVECEQGDWLGEWRGVLWATIHLHYGVDLTRVTQKDIRRCDGVVVITLPEPELLSFAIEPGSVGYLSKSTAAAKIDDLLHNGHRRELHGRLRSRALEFARRHGLMPPKQEIRAERNAATILKGSAAGLEIQFE